MLIAMELFDPGALGGFLLDRTGTWVAEGQPIRGPGELREWQSRYPGDYVAWMTFGTAALGGCFVLLLR